jgi:hypothetical protein
VPCSTPGLSAHRRVEYRVQRPQGTVGNFPSAPGEWPLATVPTNSFLSHYFLYATRQREASKQISAGYARPGPSYKNEEYGATLIDFNRSAASFL